VHICAPYDQEPVVHYPLNMIQTYFACDVCLSIVNEACDLYHSKGVNFAHLMVPPRTQWGHVKICQNARMQVAGIAIPTSARIPGIPPQNPAPPRRFQLRFRLQRCRNLTESSAKFRQILASSFWHDISTWNIPLGLYLKYCCVHS
jgi:hypothetical protein